MRSEMRSACLLDPDAITASSTNYIKLEDEEPRQIAGGPSDDGPPARLGQCAQTGPET